MMKNLQQNLLIIVALSLVRLMLQTRSWSIALRQDGIQPSTGELMLVRLASQGIGYLTVLGPIASEPMKIRLLRRHSKSPTAATLVDTHPHVYRDRARDARTNARGNRGRCAVNRFGLRSVNDSRCLRESRLRGSRW